MEHAGGLVQVYTGNGKGKTTAAFGLAVRAAGHGFRVYIGQFLKGTSYGELKLAAFTDGLVTIEQYGSESLVHDITDQDHQLARTGLEKARKAVLSGAYSVVILDEINIAMHMKLLEEADVLDLIQNRPPQVELILTGRYAPGSVLEVADLITDMREVRHPYRNGIQARKGIER